MSSPVTNMWREAERIAPAPRLPLTSLCRHARDRSDVPDGLKRYFAQRYAIFSRYDLGIRLTNAAWYGVTPEPIAQQIAQDMKNSDPSKRFLIDTFAGAGGNVIAFALSGRWERVIAIERDPNTLACAQHNARLYGVDDSMISWVLGDSFHYIDVLVNNPAQLHSNLRVDVNATVVFSSPPWGGPSYQLDKIFDLNRMEPYGLGQLHKAYKRLDHAIYLPRTSDIRQIADLIPDTQRIRVVQYCIMRASKAMVVYFPAQETQQTSASSPATPTFASVARKALDSSPVQTLALAVTPTSTSGQGTTRPNSSGGVLYPSKQTNPCTPHFTPVAPLRLAPRFSMLKTPAWT
ncbi:hypothetical protein CDD81_4149 [Ophiocordyceps australis]|uniref:Trimethylguanosine synthase n=1 Tax=Ophiocordyceps australis TaxID=1399860 RepID=A0A2C5X721_9HYPO|nr:hypothetical protein CDD81_4149 [Ophiocordyceps australis]